MREARKKGSVLYIAIAITVAAILVFSGVAIVLLVKGLKNDTSSTGLSSEPQLTLSPLVTTVTTSPTPTESPHGGQPESPTMTTSMATPAFSPAEDDPTSPPSPRSSQGIYTEIPTTFEFTDIPTTFEPTEDVTEPMISSQDNDAAIFYALGDIPYSPRQSEILLEQMETLPLDAEFVIHVGDLRLSGDKMSCMLSEYESAAERLRQSHAPVFVILGDNDWTDCPNRDDGLAYWKETFVGFESEHWDHSFTIERQEGRPENFAFVHKGTLFMGFNIIGGRRHSNSEWETRLTEQATWTIAQIERYLEGQEGAGRVVIFGHANPNNLHREYFITLRNFIMDGLDNQTPILYVNGDKHEWSYDEYFYNQPSFLRIMVSGKGVDPPLKVIVDATSDSAKPYKSFSFDRMR